MSSLEALSNAIEEPVSPDDVASCEMISLTASLSVVASSCKVDIFSDVPSDESDVVWLMDLISTTVSPVLESTTCSIIKGSVIQYFEVSQVVDDDYWLVC